MNRRSFLGSLALIPAGVQAAALKPKTVLIPARMPAHVYFEHSKGSVLIWEEELKDFEWVFRMDYDYVFGKFRFKVTALDRRIGCADTYEVDRGTCARLVGRFGPAEVARLLSS